MIPCTCIDAAGRPESIPVSKWVVNDERYRISLITWHPLQGLQGCELYEKPLDESCYPYKSFKLSRFAIDIKHLEALIELVKLSTELKSVVTTDLLENGPKIIKEPA